MEKVIFITGASSGVGYATALAFARTGAHVAVIARRAERLRELEQAINDLPTPHGDLLTLTGDVRDGAALHRAVTQTVERFGRLDVLVANAGVGHRGAVAGAEWADLEALLRTNIDGVLHSVRAAVPAMRESGGGHIIIVSSIVFNMTSPYVALYSASKAFVSSLAKSLRLELADDHITVTDVLLGRTKTEFNDKRLGKPGRSMSGGPSSMDVEQVADALVRTVETRPKTLVLRPIDRLVVWANMLVPGVIGQRVKKQYG